MTGASSYPRSRSASLLLLLDATAPTPPLWAVSLRARCWQVVIEAWHAEQRRNPPGDRRNVRAATLKLW
jgi:hypothetical protein